MPTGFFLKLIRILFLQIVFLFVFIKNTSAVSIKIDSFPPEINSGEFSVSFSVTGAATADNYFRVDLYKESTSNYFGETNNGSDWYSGNDGKQYFKNSMVSGTPAVISVSARIGNPGLGEYPGPGNYKLKIRRYTASGTAADDTQTPVDVMITHASPTPSPTPTSTPTSTPTPKPTTTPTPTPTATLTPSPSPTPIPTYSPIPTKQEEQLTDKPIEGLVLGKEDGLSGNSLTFSETFGDNSGSDSSSDQDGSTPFIALVFIVFGGILILVPFFIGVKKYINDRQNRYNSSLDGEEKSSN